eukprot:7905951-Alexandrium_andersonii.AAC.1
MRFKACQQHDRSCMPVPSGVSNGDLRFRSKGSWDRRASMILRLRGVVFPVCVIWNQSGGGPIHVKQVACLRSAGRISVGCGIIRAPRQPSQ